MLSQSEKPVNQIKQEKAAHQQASNIKTIPFNQIHALMAPTFIIQGRITFKSQLQNLVIKQRRKSYFHIVMTDSDSNNIKVNFWETEAIQFFAKLEQGKIYQVSAIKIYEPNPRYALYGSLELVCTRSTKFELIKNCKDYILPQNWNFVADIESIKHKQDGQLIDVIGLACEIQEPREVSVSNGTRITQIKNLNLIDETGKINVAVWGTEANIKIKEGQIIAIKKARVGSYGGKSITVAGYIELNPKNPKVNEILKFKQEKCKILRSVVNKTKNITDETSTISNKNWNAAPMKTVQQMKKVEDAYYFTAQLPLETTFKVTAQIKKFQSGMFYEKNNTQNWCLKMIIQGETEDDDIFLKVLAFKKTAEKIMNGLTAERASKMQRDNFEQFIAIVDQVTKSQDTYIFGICCKESSFNEVKKMDFIVETVEKL